MRDGEKVEFQLAKGITPNTYFYNTHLFKKNAKSGYLFYKKIEKTVFT